MCEHSGTYKFPISIDGDKNNVDVDTNKKAQKRSNAGKEARAAQQQQNHKMKRKL